MSTIASKNLYELLGNDPELDPDREPEPPTKVIDKPVQRTGKRNAGGEAPSADASGASAGGRGGRTDGFTRGDQAGAVNNRSERRDDGLRADRHANRTREPREYRGGDRGRGGRGRGRGYRGGPPRDDRHSHTGVGDHEKQAAHGWGAEQDGNAELADEKAGNAIAAAEAKNDPSAAADVNGGDPAFATGPGAEGEEVTAEPEDKTKSYEQYLAELAEKRLALSGDSLAVRKANEGSSQKFPEGKAFSRDPEAEHFIIGAGGKSRKAKDAQDKKERITLEGSYYVAPDAGDRGSRGGRGGRGGARGGRGESRGDRPRGRGGRGEFRGARGDGPRDGPRDGGAPRGGRGGARGGFNANDQSAFPALGA